MIATVTGIGTLMGGLGSLRLAWSRPATKRPVMILAGWTLVAISVAAFGFAIGWETGIPFALAMLPVAALGFVLANREVRPRKEGREREAVIDPSDRKSRWWRGVLRVVLAGPLSGAAAILVGVALAKQLPLSDVDAIAIGGLTVPLLWAGGMAWTLSDDKILRALAALLLVSGASYVAAFVV
ncbi:hypothetical protein [Henriciella algicola]|nr:hypothetical protein [Henriciella algicola]